VSDDRIKTGTPKPPRVSFEFFPPKNDAQAMVLEETASRLARFRPSYVSVTYGAGGTSQERSRGTVARMLARGLPTAAHLTCAGADCDAIGQVIDGFRAAGIDRFVALRGDPPGGLAQPYRPHPVGFRDTSDLVRALKRAGAVEVFVSAYPERHPQSADWNAEIDTLWRKVDAGADCAITQFFFDNDLFESYLERIRRRGIAIAIVPGIMPIHSFAAVRSFAERCGASVPDDLASRFDGLEPDSEAHGLLAAAFAAEQVTDLMRRGVDAFHIYTLNRAELPEAICQSCGIAPQSARAAA
jgi:methylenetetrahydrofolate reductase (NADPH)